jgi:hypothetical protein
VPPGCALAVLPLAFSPSEITPLARTSVATSSNLAQARQKSKTDPRIYDLCILQPATFLQLSQESRHTLLREAEELLLLSSVQDCVRSEWLEHKPATPNQNIAFGVRHDKVFNTNSDAGSVILKLPAAALAALQIGIAVQLKPQPVVKPSSTDLASL